MTKENKKNTKSEAILTKFRKELEEDSKVDLTNLMSDIMMTTTLQSKWLNYHSRFKESYIINHKKLKELRASKFLDTLTGVNGYEVTSREASKLMDGDKDIVDLEEKIAIIEAVLDFFSDAQKIIRDKAFAISNIIRLKEFEAGMM